MDGNLLIIISWTLIIYLINVFNVVATQSSSSELSQCPVTVNEEIQRCVQPVANYAKMLNQQEESPSSGLELDKAIQLPKIGGKVFEELCRLIRQFEVCVRDHRTQCRNHITISLIEASYGYLCNEGYDTFLNSAECLMELDQQPAVKECHDMTLKNIAKANSQAAISVSKKLGDMCGALNSFSSCVMNPIRTNCGADAWMVIFRVLRDTTRTLMPTCAFNTRRIGASLTESREASRARGRMHHGRMHGHHRPTPAAINDPILASADFTSDNNNNNSGKHSNLPQQSALGEGNLRYIQVEVGENRQANSAEDDFYRSSNHRRKFKNSANSVHFTGIKIFAVAFLLIFLYIFSTF